MRDLRQYVVAPMAALAFLVAACGGNGSTDGVLTAEGVVAPDGFRIEIVADGFTGPTQFVVLADGGLLVAELNGSEREGSGRVVRTSPEDPTIREVLVDELLVPTGVAVDGDLLWIMEQRRLTVGPLADPTDRTIVLDELPSNGRSEGTITTLAAGGILYDTSGSRDPDSPEVLKPGSGTLWTLARPGADPVPFATGFKHAYAHVVDAENELWSTEMSDGRLDGATPPDELVQVRLGDDFGYPRCIGDGVPVAELGADQKTCDGTPRSHALFDVGATPTGVAVAPWDPEVLVVALWNRGEVVTVPRSDVGRPHRPQVLLTGIDNPQHLVADGDRLLIGDHGRGRIVALSRS